MIIKNELKMEPWYEMFLNVKKKREVVRVLVANVGMHSRLKRTLSDVCSPRKRAARYCLFASLRHEMLLSRSSAITTERIRQKKREMVLA